MATAQAVDFSLALKQLMHPLRSWAEFHALCEAVAQYDESAPERWKHITKHVNRCNPCCAPILSAPCSVAGDGVHSVADIEFAAIHLEERCGMGAHWSTSRV